ncbi:MAG: hypothetical protein AB7E27_01100 [Candidatus Methanomethylophilaceae archaeon]
MPVHRRKIRGCWSTSSAGDVHQAYMEGVPSQRGGRYKHHLDCFHKDCGITVWAALFSVNLVLRSLPILDATACSIYNILRVLK